MAWPGGFGGANAPEVNEKPRFSDPTDIKLYPQDYISTVDAYEKYFVWSPLDYCYVFEDGQRVELNGSLRLSANENAKDPTTALKHQLANLMVNNSSAKIVSSPMNSKPSLRGAIKETEGRAERLDPSYMKQDHPREFFKTGKVFKVLWPETTTPIDENVTNISDVKFVEQKFVAKIRWFIVLKEGESSANCVPIQTYDGRGVGKRGVAKWMHAVVFTGKVPPNPLPQELPRKGGRGMLEAIRIVSKFKMEKLSSMSRVNLGKLYTIEHGVKVYDFGNVHSEHITILKQQWRWVLGPIAATDYDTATKKLDSDPGPSSTAKPYQSSQGDERDALYELGDVNYEEEENGNDNDKDGDIFYDAALTQS